MTEPSESRQAQNVIMSAPQRLNYGTTTTTAAAGLHKPLQPCHLHPSTLPPFPPPLNTLDFNCRETQPTTLVHRNSNPDTQQECQTDNPSCQNPSPSPPHRKSPRNAKYAPNCGPMRSSSPSQMATSPRRNSSPDTCTGCCARGSSSRGIGG